MKNNLNRTFKRNTFSLGLFVGLLVIGVFWQMTMKKIEMRQYAPVGELINVNGYDMHFYNKGEGDSTIVFIAGSGTPNSYVDFYYLQNELQKYANTVSFDQAGYGWSEDTKNSRTIDNIVSDLHVLLEESNQSPPYIFVAHSLASLEAFRYVQLYPEEVQGIILLDGGSPQFYANYSEIKALLINRMMAALRATGINRALGSIGVKLPLLGENVRYKNLPDEIKEVDEAMYYNFIGDSSNLDMIKYMNENAQKVIDNGDLQDIPLLILSTDNGGEWGKVQLELLDWSNNSSQKKIEGSKHYLHWSNKERVLAEVLEFLKDY